MTEQSHPEEQAVVEELIYFTWKTLFVWLFCNLVGLFIYFSSFVSAFSWNELVKIRTWPLFGFNYAFSQNHLLLEKQKTPSYNWVKLSHNPSRSADLGNPQFLHICSLLQQRDFLCACYCLTWSSAVMPYWAASMSVESWAIFPYELKVVFVFNQVRILLIFLILSIQQ